MRLQTIASFVLVLCHGVAAVSATAQRPRASTGKESAQDNKQSIFEKMSHIALQPATAVVDATRPDVTLYVRNLSDDSVPLSFCVMRSSRGPCNPATDTRVQNGWIRGLPRWAMLGPWETQAVPLRVVAPEDTRPGTYVLYVVVHFKPTIMVDRSTDLSGDAIPLFFADTTADGFPRRAYVRSTITYTMSPQRRQKPTKYAP